MILICLRRAFLIYCSHIFFSTLVYRSNFSVWVRISRLSTIFLPFKNCCTSLFFIRTILSSSMSSYLKVKGYFCKFSIVFFWEEIIYSFSLHNANYCFLFYCSYVLFLRSDFHFLANSLTRWYIYPIILITSYYVLSVSTL